MYGESFSDWSTLSTEKDKAPHALKADGRAPIQQTVLLSFKIACLTWKLFSCHFPECIASALSFYSIFQYFLAVSLL